MIYLTKDVLPLFVWLFLWGNSCSPLQGHADEITPYGEKTYLKISRNLFPQRQRLWFTTSTLSLACATNRLRRKVTFGQLMDLWVNSQFSIIRKATIGQLVDSWAKPIPATVLPPQINQAPILGAQNHQQISLNKKVARLFCFTFSPLIHTDVRATRFVQISTSTTATTMEQRQSLNRSVW